MLQLICHHTYKTPFVAIDLSRHQNHGALHDAVHLVDGASPSSGAVAFRRPTANVHIGPSSSFSPLGTLRIDVRARIDAVLPADRMNLVEGHLAFAFFIDPGGVLVGTFLGPSAAGAPPSWHGVQSQPPFSPDGARHTVPVGTWTTLSYGHDGHRTIEVSIDGRVVGRRNDLVAGVPPVGSGGTTVGSWPNAARFSLQGAVDDLKIWRCDPNAVADEFLSRPLGDREGACWAELFAALARAMRSDPRLAAAGAGLQRMRSDGGRNAAGDAAALARNRAFAARFLALWRSGKLSGDPMRALLREWLPELFRSTGIGPSHRGLSAEAERVAASDVVGRFRGFDCDPEFAAFIRLLGEEIRSF